MKNKCSNTSRLLAYSTRIIFMLLVFLSASQITCTIMFMLMCRQDSRDLVLTLDLSVDPCKGQGIPAYIAFLILLVTIFGFGCVGRKATSVILFLVGIFDVAMSTYLEIQESHQDFSQIIWDLNHTTNLCMGHYSNSSQINISNSNHNNFKTCYKIYSALDQTCKDLDLDLDAIGNFKNMQNCSHIIIAVLKDIKFRFHPISLPLSLFSSIMYMVLSIMLFYIQFHDKRLPGYRRREHILHRPEFRECPTSDDANGDGNAHWSFKLCLLNVLWCQWYVMFTNSNCCRRKQPTTKMKDVYELKALKTRFTHEDPMQSITNLV